MAKLSERSVIAQTYGKLDGGEDLLWWRLLRCSLRVRAKNLVLVLIGTSVQIFT